VFILLWLYYSLPHSVKLLQIRFFLIIISNTICVQAPYIILSKPPTFTHKHPNQHYCSPGFLMVPFSVPLVQMHLHSTSNHQSDNTTKAEHLIIDTLREWTKLISISISFPSNLFTQSDSASNIGVILEIELSLTRRIVNISHTAFLDASQLCQISK